MTTFGNLRIASSARIDGAGPFEGEPALYHWPWYWHLPGLGLWLLLVLALVLPRANRHPHAWLIFIPLLIASLLWPQIARLAGMSSATEMQFSFLIEFLVVGTALLWLHADRLGRSGRRMRFAMGLGLMFLADLVAALSYWGTFPRQSGMLLVFTAIIGVVLLLSLALTRRLARGRYRPLRFMLWLAVWSMTGSVAAAAAFVGILMLSSSYRINDPRVLLFQVLMPVW
jgi:hypothetical protein